MFKLNENYDVDQKILKRDYIRHSPSELSTLNLPNSQIYTKIPRGDSVKSLLGNLLRLNFDVLHAATNNRYIGGVDLRLATECPIALFKNYKLQSSSGKHIEEINRAHRVCLMYKLITSVRNTDDLSIGFDRDLNWRKRELTNNKNIKGKFHVTIMLGDIVGSVEHQEKGAYRLVYKLTLTRNSDNAVLNKANATNNVEIKINSSDWYIPHYTTSLTQEKIVLSQIVNKKPTELRYVERSFFMKELNTQNLWTFELGTQDGINVPIWVIVGFQQSDRQHDQNLNNHTFYRPPVKSAQRIIGTENYPGSAILLNYNDDDYSQGYSQIKEVFRALTHDELLQPYIGENDYRSSNNGNRFGYNLYVFDRRYQKFLNQLNQLK